MLVRNALLIAPLGLATASCGEGNESEAAAALFARHGMVIRVPFVGKHVDVPGIYHVRGELGEVADLTAPVERFLQELPIDHLQEREAETWCLEDCGSLSIRRELDVDRFLAAGLVSSIACGRQLRTWADEGLRDAWEISGLLPSRNSGFHAFALETAEGWQGIVQLEGIPTELSVPVHLRFCYLVSGGSLVVRVEGFRSLLRENAVDLWWADGNERSDLLDLNYEGRIPGQGENYFAWSSKRRIAFEGGAGRGYMMGFAYPSGASLWLEECWGADGQLRYYEGPPEFLRPAIGSPADCLVGRPEEGVPGGW